MKSSSKAQRVSSEFISLLAAMTALVALSIDAMLPALPTMGKDLAINGSNETQLVISMLLTGLALGQLIYGPLSDSIGRKRPILMGYGLFIVGCLFSAFSTSFSMMLFGRFLQGLGVAAPRSVSMALVRDLFSGDQMAKVMSYIMTVFILVPMLAPAYGQVLISIANWRAIFLSLIVLALLSSLWFYVRQPETLTVQARKPFSFKQIMTAFKEVLSHRVAFGYTLAAGLISGAFLGYLNSSQQIFQDIYGLGERFAFFFAIVAFSLGLASFINGQLVMRYGMKNLAHNALYGLSILSVIALGLALSYAGKPPLWLLMAYLLSGFFCVGILFGNLNALAMQPLGHIAGVGASVVGSLSTLISVPLGTVVGLNYNGTILPLLMGFSSLALLTVLVLRWVNSSQLKADSSAKTM